MKLGDKKIFPVLLSDKEKLLFNEAARRMGWATNRYIRVATKAFIILQSKKITNLQEAMEKALEDEYAIHPS